jgi:hypothetical protein
VTSAEIRLLESARALAVDGWTAEAVRALRRAGVRVLLLKGPALTRWLYDRGEERGYLDADLMVEPERIRGAERVLTSLGYALGDPEAERWGLSGAHAQTWLRPADGALIDLHHKLPAVAVPGGVVWPVLWERCVTMSIGGEDVPVLDETSRTLMVALHAFHHGVEIDRPAEDLRRAVERVPESVWADAAVIAESIMALPQFAGGLALAAEGERLARRINVPSGERILALESDPLALGFERLAATRGFRPRMVMLRREAFPSAAFMHWWTPWASGSRGLLVLAYAYRIGWLATHAGPGWRAWRAAQSEGSR